MLTCFFFVFCLVFDTRVVRLAAETSWGFEVTLSSISGDDSAEPISPACKGRGCIDGFKGLAIGGVL